MSADTAPARLLYSLDQAAEALGGLSRAAIYDLLRSGELPSVYLGRRRFITADALAAFVAALPTEPP